ncbi:hypothetical protein DV515_00013782 [Chloebia gouldiae]|uniref:Uncharacterized protein n=1 Tax=Chloebia gouldiae TaxID=44316 RepID=A0A3L8S039_CHLGU|nr:hypothetical protein DV515_00013782 [Chloebia gouldiae]
MGVSLGAGAPALAQPAVLGTLRAPLSPGGSAPELQLESVVWRWQRQQLRRAHRHGGHAPTQPCPAVSQPRPPAPRPRGAIGTGTGHPTSEGGPGPLCPTGDSVLPPGPCPAPRGAVPRA